MNEHHHRLLVAKRLLYTAFVFGMLKTIDLSLRLLGYRRVCQYLVLCSPRPYPNLVNFPSAFSTARVVNRVASHHLGSAACLRRSLLVWWLLRWRRIPTVLRIGVNPEGGHAWVEHHGQVINDRPDVATTYSPLYSDQLSPEGISGFQ